MKTAAAACVLARILSVASGALVAPLSFEKPFDEISANGEREISKSFLIGGHTQVNRHFVRLTTDRQSKRGYIWSKDSIQDVARLTDAEFSVVLTFRISGQAEKWFGDGLALWLTTEPRHVDGGLHGFKDKFTGFGVIIDTFVNSEKKGGHKDIELIVNDGTRDLDNINDAVKKGCDSKTSIRYHEKNAKFSPSSSMSRLKVSFSRNNVRIEVDPSNSGTWSDCYSEKLELPSNWYTKATVGVTASTGSLADTHDVIGLSFYEYVTP
jgi:mannose-binding lectin 2